MITVVGWFYIIRLTLSANHALPNLLRYMLTDIRDDYNLNGERPDLPCFQFQYDH